LLSFASDATAFDRRRPWGTVPWWISRSAKEIRRQFSHRPWTVKQFLETHGALQGFLRSISAPARPQSTRITAGAEDLEVDVRGNRRQPGTYGAHDELGDWVPIKPRYGPIP